MLRGMFAYQDETKRVRWKHLRETTHRISARQVVVSSLEQLLAVRMKMSVMAVLRNTSLAQKVLTDIATQYESKGASHYLASVTRQVFRSFRTVPYRVQRQADLVRRHQHVQKHRQLFPEWCHLRQSLKANAESLRMKRHCSVILLAKLPEFRRKLLLNALSPWHRMSKQFNHWCMASWARILRRVTGPARETVMLQVSFGQFRRALQQESAHKTAVLLQRRTEGLQALNITYIRREYNEAACRGSSLLICVCVREWRLRERYSFQQNKAKENLLQNAKRKAARLKEQKKALMVLAFAAV